MNPAVPAVEITHDAEPFGIGRPDRECNSVNTVELTHVSAKLFVRTLQRLLAEQVEIHLAQSREKAVGIVYADARSVAQQNFKAVTKDSLIALNQDFEKIGALTPRHRQRYAAFRLHANRFRIRPVRADGRPPRSRMRPKNGMGIRITEREKPLQVTRRGSVRLRGPSDYWCCCHILQLANAPLCL